MKTAAAICLVMLVAAPALGFAQDRSYPDFGSIAKQPPASKGPPPATQPPIAQPPASQAPGSQPSTTQTRETWRQLMARTPVPKAGCYTSSYPSTQWQEVPCSTAEARPHIPAIGTEPHNAGAGNDFSAQVLGSLSSVTGSLESVTGVTTESDQSGQNAFSLQLNTNNNIITPLCANQQGCNGWQQYVYDSPGNVYIQYWLLSHGNPCPANPATFTDTWHYFSGSPGQRSGCFINGKQTPVPSQAITDTDLAGLRLTGNSSPGAQSAVLGVETSMEPPVKMYTAKDDGDLLGIGTQWNTAEFNVFGSCCGNLATFNPGSTIVVQTQVDDGTTTAPICDGGFTAESNNLTLVSPCFAYAAPGIVFTEQFMVPIAGCNFPNAATTCVGETGSNANISEDTYTVTCTAPLGLSMQRLNNGSWVSLPQHCSDGSAPGTCSSSVIVPNEFVVGTQEYGVTQSGGGVGTTQTVQVCYSASQCTPFQLTIPQCASLPSPNDQFYVDLNDNPVQAGQGGSGLVNLLMAGPWVASDLGNNAIGKVLSTTLPPGSTTFLYPGYADNQGHAYGVMEFYVTVPLSVNPGFYTATVQGQDVVSGVTHNVIVPIQILPCVPTTMCPPNSGLCGPISNGCGGTVDCGACAAGLTCSNFHCCATGYFYNTGLNGCEPLSCPTGTSYCYALGTCATDAQCQKASKPYCQKVNGKVQCQ